MSFYHDQLTAMATSQKYRLAVLDEKIPLPRWLERRLGWGRKHDVAQALRAEGALEREPQGKDATKDW
ncbi:MAG: hypothetical protein U0869_25585 [Chloroflexota bacterium]